ncbi:MAG TPA: class I SAM-dependent methyltransferase [Planctomycetota bacterium]
MLDRKQEYTSMAEVEGTLWWYRALHHLVLAAIRAHAGTADPEIVDAGCGTGGLMLFLRARGLRRVRGFDLSADAVAWCRKRELDVQQGNLLDVGRLQATHSADVIVSNDTMYFLDRDQQQRFVQQCADVLRPGGLLILNLPALRAFAGIHDLSVGIRDRFSRADTKRLLAKPSFEVVRETYWPFVLSPLVWLARAAQRRTMRTNKDFTVRSDIDLPPRWLNKALLALVRAENALLRRKPFGSSLFLVGRRATQPSSVLSSEATRSTLASGSSG